MPDARDVILKHIAAVNDRDSAADPWAAAEGTIAGTHDGVLHTPNGDVAPTGRAVELRWAAVYATDGETLKSEHLFFDQMDLLGQLGLLPG